jgi:hypothetical protein
MRVLGPRIELLSGSGPLPTLPLLIARGFFYFHAD